MRKNDEKNSLVTTIIVIASAIVVAVGVILAIKTICSKYKITERRPKKKFIDFDDADDWTIDESEPADLCNELESSGSVDDTTDEPVVGSSEFEE